MGVLESFWIIILKISPSKQEEAGRRKPNSCSNRAAIEITVPDLVSLEVDRERADTDRPHPQQIDSGP